MGRKANLIRERIDITDDLDGTALDAVIRTLSTLRERHGNVTFLVSAHEEHGEPCPRIALEIERPESRDEAARRVERERRHEERLRRHYEQLRDYFEGKASRRSATR